MRTRRFTKKLTSKQVGLKHGFRSGLEEKVAEQLREKGVKYEFEETKLKYVKPQKTHTYTPDFFLIEQNIYIESKGLFATADRQKMILVKAQHPDLDIRFVFSNANSRISKKSKTTYAMWAEKNNFQWSHRVIPQEWLNEK